MNISLYGQDIIELTPLSNSVPQGLSELTIKMTDNSELIFFFSRKGNIGEAVVVVGEGKTITDVTDYYAAFKVIDGRNFVKLSDTNG